MEVYIIGEVLPCLAGSINENHSGGAGGGVLNYTSGTFTMTGGLISGNATERSGAGVCNWEGQFIMSDNAVISHNVSTDTYGGGGGVFNFNRYIHYEWWFYQQ